MINVNDMYVKVGLLISKDKAGYFSNAEFNGVSKEAELLLFQYYTANYEQNNIVPTEMLPFTVEEVKALSSLSRTTVPSDNAAVQQIWWRKVTNATSCGMAPTVDQVRIDYLEKGELSHTLDSPIRKPSLTASQPRIYWANVAQGIQVYPNMSGANVTFDYLRFPVYAVRGVTLDTTNDQENYDASTSTQYEWDDSCEPDLVDLIMLHYGMSIRDSAITQWAAQKNIIVKQSLSSN